MKAFMNKAPAAVASHRCACGGIVASRGGECAQCRAKRLQRRPDFARDHGRPSGGDIQNDIAGARPLDPSVRQRMESGFGVNFENVRVHDNATSHEAARSMGALAFTTGQDVFFGARQYEPASPRGQRLLAHELAHTIQQRGAAIAGAAQAYVVDANESPWEREAETAAASVVDGGHARITHGVSAGVSPRVQRQAADTRSTGQDVNRAMRESIPVAKWSPVVEALYRKAGDDESANAVAKCRREGAHACAWLLTPKEVDGLFHLANQANGDAKKMRSGLKDVVPLLGFAPMGFAAEEALVAKLTADIGATAVRTAATGALAAESTAAAVGTAEATAVGGAATSAGTAAAASMAVTIAISAAVVAILAVAVYAAYELYQMAKFQTALRQKGFTILKDPLGQAICTGCHSAPARSKPPFAFRDFPNEAPDLLRREDYDEIERWIDGRPRPTADAAPDPDTQTREETRNRCPHPTGLTRADPIRMVWYKPRVDDYYPKSLIVDQREYDRDDPDNPQRLPLGEPLGVLEEYWPYEGKRLQLTKEPRGSAAHDFRKVLTRYDFDWSGLQADHVQDVDWGGPDVFENLWPLSSSANVSAGVMQNRHQLINWCETPRGPAFVAKPLSAFKELPGRYGRHFIVSRVVRWND